MNLAQLLLKAARSHGARPAVSVGGEARLDYAELAVNPSVSRARGTPG